MFLECHYTQINGQFVKKKINILEDCPMFVPLRYYPFGSF